ncbi:MAG: dynamin family protein [Salinisphaeraceae bacterium]|nr:dynamin family protein [Salinisphaeraceae bacterium]
MADSHTANPMSLEEHLKRENELLLEPLAGFRKLDRIAHRLQLLDKSDSLTRRVPWWPVISILGTFSAGKSTFLNRYLQSDLQMTGNQAVDDRFTVICYSDDGKPRTLPGSALDADPRFPFYRISGDIDEVAAGEGGRINTFLQIKTCNSELVRGKILLDSPGFDADSQRTATLRITDRIIDLSDLVLVFFDARHPEPGAMRDTLQHLVADTINRDDASKFLFVLNQIDVTAKEDNPEDIVAAWQRALASCGLTAGRFLRIYDEQSAAPMPDAALARRFKAKKDEDMTEIMRRFRDVGIERAYRIVDMLSSSARILAGEQGVGQVQGWLQRWRSRVLLFDALLLMAALGLVAAGLLLAQDKTLALLSTLVSGSVTGWVVLGGFLIIAATAHFSVRNMAAGQILAKIPVAANQPLRMDVRRAFRANTRWFRSIFSTRPKGWHMFSRKEIDRIVESREPMVQKLNDRFTRPSG